MRKRMMAVLLAGLLAGFYSLPVAATEQAADAQTELKLADVDVEIFDINSVAYQGSSVLPLMSAAVVIVVLGALVTIVLVCRTSTYE